MSYCFNPFCQTPFNPQDSQFCDCCGASLLLNNRYIALRPLRDRSPSLLAVDTFQPMRPLCVIQPIVLQEDVKQSSPQSHRFFLSSRTPSLHQLLELGLHPQIPNLITQFVQHGDRYLVQEFIEGRSLAQELALEGCFTEIKVRRLLSELLPLLQLIHRHQLAHGEIKPANLIRRRGTNRLFLVDLRSTRACDAPTQPSQTSDLPYQDPTQTERVMPFIADLQSLGATCIHLLTQIPLEQLLDTPQLQCSPRNPLPWQRFLQHAIDPALLQLIHTLYTAPLTGHYVPPLLLLQEMERSRPHVQVTLPKPANKSMWVAHPSNGATAPCRDRPGASVASTPAFPKHLPPSEAYIGSVDETLPPNWWMLN